jgi:hypothetical protein
VSLSYIPGVDPTENTASNNPIAMCGCLGIDWTSFPQERVYWPLLRNSRLFICLLHSNGCTRPFWGLCPATGLYAAIWMTVVTHTKFGMVIDCKHIYKVCMRVYYIRCPLMFQRNMLPPSSWSKSKPSKKQAAKPACHLLNYCWEPQIQLCLKHLFCSVRNIVLHKSEVMIGKF